MNYSTTQMWTGQLVKHCCRLAVSSSWTFRAS